MNLALWAIAGLLAVVALTGGVTKVFVPKEKLAAAPGGGWTGGASVGFIVGSVTNLGCVLRADGMPEDR